MVPLLLDVRRHSRTGVAPNGQPTVVTVGRIVPNKRVEDVIKAFALFRSIVRRRPGSSSWAHRPASSVIAEHWIALSRSSKQGMSSSPAQSRAGRATRGTCRLTPISQCLYTKGFLRAARRGTRAWSTVVARRAGAVAETLGGAGLVLDGDDLPLFAEGCMTSSHLLQRARRSPRSGASPAGACAGIRNTADSCRSRSDSRLAREGRACRPALWRRGPRRRRDPCSPNR